MKVFPKLLFCFFLGLMMFSCKDTSQDNADFRQKIAEGIITIPNPAKDSSSLPYLFSNRDKLFLSWVTKEDSIATLSYSEFSEGKWMSPEAIASGSDWFVNWADFPGIAENNGNLLTHFLKKSDTAYFAYDVFINLKNESEDKWREPFKLHSDTTKTEHGFVSIIPFEKDSFFVTWLDGRDTASKDETMAMNIRAAMVTSAGEIIDDTLLDKRTCDCCHTAAALTGNGPVVIYRDRMETEVRDISIVRFIDGIWTEPKPIHNDNWEIKGCPVNGPKADAIENTLVITWFTAAENIPKVNVIFSGDAGENFSEPIRIDNGNPIGKVDVSLIDKDNALVSWVEGAGSDARIKVVKVTSKGDKSESLVVSNSTDARANGFPQMEILGKNVYFAWTVEENGGLHVETSFLPLKDF
ncbi:MAG TPA: hypothetical protein VFD29_05660 [Gillisia sp.]|nr:hypothetical protein [Gillisia sp.]